MSDAGCRSCRSSILFRSVADIGRTEPSVSAQTSNFCNAGLVSAATSPPPPAIGDSEDDEDDKITVASCGDIVGCLRERPGKLQLELPAKELVGLQAKASIIRTAK